METDRRYTLDASVWRSRDGRTLIGGSDFTVVALDGEQRAELNRLLLGSRRPSDNAAFVRFLTHRNLVQPVAEPTELPEVALVIPCRNQQDELSQLLATLDLTLFSEVVVLDDGSSTPLVTVPASVRVIRHARSLGSGAARNTGWQATAAAFVLFLDADVSTDGAWVRGAAAHLHDPSVAAVAPRVRSIPTQNRAGRWEQIRPALDLGSERSLVMPRTRVPYVPTAALLIRRDALQAVGGFDPSMTRGEDVDLVWRLHDRGGAVRYEPEFEVGHRPRTTVRAWIGQRVTYGRSNVALARAHPTHVVGLELTWWNAAPLLLPARWRPLKAIGFAAGSAGVVVLRHRLADRCAEPDVMALRLQRDGIAYATQAVARAAVRTYWPLAVLSSMFSRRSRWLLAAGLVAPLRDWFRRSPETPTLEWLAASIADDLSFGAGVWFESIRCHSTRALRVHFSPIGRFLPGDVPGVSRQQSR
jgi:mycofactocin system glycosyltransferase